MLAHLEPVLHSKRSHHDEQPTLQPESSPSVLQLEKACLATKTKINKRVKLVFKTGRGKVQEEGTGQEGAAWELGYCHMRCVSLGRKKRWAVISENQQLVTKRHMCSHGFTGASVIGTISLFSSLYSVSMFRGAYKESRNKHSLSCDHPLLCQL